MKKQKPIVWIVAFLIVIASPSITFFLLEQYIDTENYENRGTGEKPKLTVQNLEDFPAEFEKYYNDNVPYRNQLIRMNNSIDYFVFGQSSNDKVIIGRDGWLFYTGDGNPVEQSLGYWTFSEEEMREIAENLTVSQKVLESQGIEFVLFIAPNKETIYMEKLPEQYRKLREQTSTEQLVEYLKENTDIRVVYPKDELLEAKALYPSLTLYYKLDTHWNDVGGYMGAVSLAKELGINMPALDAISVESHFTSSGDLTKLLNITIRDGDINYKLNQIKDKKAERVKWDFDTEYIFHREDAELKTLFMRRDSYATALAPSIAEFFNDSIFVHKNSFEQQQIFDYNTDVFVLETVERLESQLKDFRISFISLQVDEVMNGEKKITISPAIDGENLRYVSVYKKKANSQEGIVQVQEMEHLNDDLVLWVPETERGEVSVFVYEDAEGTRLIEKIVKEY